MNFEINRPDLCRRTPSQTTVPSEIQEVPNNRRYLTAVGPSILYSGNQNGRKAGLPCCKKDWSTERKLPIVGCNILESHSAWIAGPAQRDPQGALVFGLRDILVSAASKQLWLGKAIRLKSYLLCIVYEGRCSQISWMGKAFRATATSRSSRSVTPATARSR